MPPTPHEVRTSLYVVSSRKPDDIYHEISPRRLNKREAHLHAPKRAGTYALFAAPFEKPDLQEDDLTPVVDDATGLPFDTDLKERERAAPGTSRSADEEGVRTHDQQDRVEDRIAAFLWRALCEPIVLFVHGYNVKPDDAIKSAQKLQQHLDRNGLGVTVVPFHWPSNGHILDYFPDQKAAGRFGTYALVNLLMSLRRATGALPLHCVAHSMGTYVVTRALGTVAILQIDRLLPPEAEGTLLDEVAFMQPDIDFDCLCSGYVGPKWDSPSYLEIPDGYAATKLARRLTIYCSTNDVALFGSLFENRTKRLGAYGPGLEERFPRDRLMQEKVRQNVHVVNVDDWCLFDFTSGHSHSHFLQCPHMMDDVAAVLRAAPRVTNPMQTPVAPRWYKLSYPEPGPLRGMASFWKGVGSFFINAPMMALVKLKKRIQLTLRLARTLSAFWLLAAGLVAGTAWRDQPVGFAAMLGCAAALAVYALLWAYGRRVQVKEDAPMPAAVLPLPPPPQPPAPPPSEEMLRSFVLSAVQQEFLRHSPLLAGLRPKDHANLVGKVRRMLATLRYGPPDEELLTRIVIEVSESQWRKRVEKQVDKLSGGDWKDNV